MGGWKTPFDRERARAAREVGRRVSVRVPFLGGLDKLESAIADAAALLVEKGGDPLAATWSCEPCPTYHALTATWERARRVDDSTSLA